MIDREEVGALLFNVSDIAVALRRIEQLLEEDGTSPHTAHTTNPVPLVVTSHELGLREGGEWADLAPTVLRLLGFRQPLQMTGKPLTTLAE